MRVWLAIAAAVIGMDQITKHLAVRLLQPHEPAQVLPFINFDLAYNPGAAFSFLADSDGWQRWFFVVLALGVSAVIVGWLRRLGPAERWNGVALSLILGGALGNAIDRIFFGHVIDFIDVYYMAESCMPLFSPLSFADRIQCHWPSFNLADSAISIGAAVMIVDAVFASKRAT